MSLVDASTSAPPTAPSRPPASTTPGAGTVPSDGPGGLNCSAWLAAAVAAVEDAVIAVDLDGTIRDWNPAAEALYGYSAAEVCGRSLSLLAPPELHAEQAALRAHVAAGGRVRNHETERVRRDGRRVIVALSLTPMPGPDGRIVGIAAVARDLTAQRSAAADQQLTAERLRLATQLAGVGAWDWDVRTRRSTWSAEQCALFGIDPATFGGTREEMLARVHPEDRAAMDAVTIDLIEGRRDEVALTYRVHWPDGSVHWLEVRAGALRNARGQLTRVVGVTMDVTRQKLGQVELARRERELAGLLDHLPDLVVRFDRTLRFAYVNPALERANGQPAAALLGRNVRDLGIPEAVAHFWEASLHRILTTGVSESLLVHLPTPAGDRMYQAVGVPEPAQDGASPSVLVVARDVTDRVRAEEVREELYRELLERERRLRDLIERVLLDRGGGRAAVATAARDALLLELTARERELLRLVAAGQTNAQIGTALALSAGTVRNQLVLLFRKLGVTDRAQAAARAVSLGLIDG